MFKAAFKEVVDEIHVGARTAEETIKDMREHSTFITGAFRWGAWLMSCVGHWLLFSPII